MCAVHSISERARAPRISCCCCCSYFLCCLLFWLVVFVFSCASFRLSCVCIFSRFFSLVVCSNSNRVKLSLSNVDRKMITRHRGKKIRVSQVVAHVWVCVNASLLAIMFYAIFKDRIKLKRDRWNGENQWNRRNVNALCAVTWCDVCACVLVSRCVYTI